jgi:hypothetical protein
MRIWMDGSPRRRVVRAQRLDALEAPGSTVDPGSAPATTEEV